MDRRPIHAKIRAKFNLKRRTDNLPHGSRRGYTRFTLSELLGELQFNVGAEIGVRRGNYSRHLCAQNPNLLLHCIDPWDAYDRAYTAQRQERIYQEAVANLQGLNVQILRKSSMDALADFKDESLDFVFIDGNHSFDHVCPDIIFWSKKVRSGGIVSAHDYYGFGWAGVVEAVDAYTRSHHIDPWYRTKELEPTVFWVKP